MEAPMGKPNTQWCDECGKYTKHVQVEAKVTLKGRRLKGKAYIIQCINAHRHKPRKEAA